MNPGERLEFVQMVRALDLAVRQVRSVYWPLCLPALTIMQQHDHGRRMRPCPMPHCGLCSGHRCECEVRKVRHVLTERGWH